MKVKIEPVSSPVKTILDYIKDNQDFFDEIKSVIENKSKSGAVKVNYLNEEERDVFIHWVLENPDRYEQISIPNMIRLKIKVLTIQYKLKSIHL